MRAFVHTEILDHSILGDKIYDGSIDMVDYIYALSAKFDTVDINGGTIDGTVIGRTAPAAITGTAINATSYIGIPLKSQLNSLGELLLYDGSAKVYITPRSSPASLTSFYNGNKFVWGATAMSGSHTVSFEFAKRTTFLDHVYMDANLVLTYGGFPYYVGTWLSHFREMYTEYTSWDTWEHLCNLTPDEVDQLENIGGVTISPTQWSYLGSFNQPLSNIDSPTFYDLTVSNVLTAANLSCGGNVAFGDIVTGKIQAGGDAVEAGESIRAEDDIATSSNFKALNGGLECGFDISARDVGVRDIAARNLALTEDLSIPSIVYKNTDEILKQNTIETLISPVSGWASTSSIRSIVKIYDPLFINNSTEFPGNYVKMYKIWISAFIGEAIYNPSVYTLYSSDIGIDLPIGNDEFLCIDLMVRNYTPTPVDAIKTCKLVINTRRPFGRKYAEFNGSWKSGGEMYSLLNQNVPIAFCMLDDGLGAARIEFDPTYGEPHSLLQDRIDVFGTITVLETSGAI